MTTMPAFAAAHAADRPIPLGEIWPWLLFVPLFCLAIYMVGAEEGAASLIPGMYIHEFFHDARHLLSFPCH